MNIDERLQALTMNLELASRDIQDLRASVQERRVAQQEGFAETRRIFEVALDSIRRLENVAGAHQRKFEDLENR
jgi:hypothetical protein